MTRNILFFYGRVCSSCSTCGRVVGRSRGCREGRQAIRASSLSTWRVACASSSTSGTDVGGGGGHDQSRAGAVWESISSFPLATIHLAEGWLGVLHSHTHLPWWGVIVLSTITFRSAITLPLAVHQNRLVARVELLMPTLKEYQEAVKHNIITKCRRANLPVDEANKRFRKEARKVAWSLYAQEGCHPLKMFLLPWIQLPLWFTLSFALRNMSGVFPGLEPPADTLQSLAAEGTLWFQDLTLPDPHGVLSVSMAVINLLNIELHAMRRKNAGMAQRSLTNFFRILSVAIGFIGMQLPAAMTLYWTTSSAYGLTQNIFLQFPRVRRALRIPKTPSESKRPFQDLWALARARANNFLAVQREAAREMKLRKEIKRKLRKEKK